MPIVVFAFVSSLIHRTPKKQLRASQALGLWPFGVFLSHHQAIDSEAKYTYGRVYDENLNIIKRWIKDAGFQVVEARQEAGQRHGLAGRAWPNGT